MKPETQNFYAIAVRRAAETVLASLDQALDLDQLARVAALSPFHFHRIFRGMVGETPLELHRRLRLERAAFRLLHESAPVTAAALEAGYDSHEAFTRAFRARYGHCPSDFRGQRDEHRSDCERPYQIEITARCGVHFNPAPSSPFTLQLLRGDRIMFVETKHMPELRVAAVRHIGPYNQISEAFSRLGQTAGLAGLITGKPVMLAIYHDDPEVTPEAALRSDAGLVIADRVTLPAGLSEHRLPAGTYGCYTHIGPYEHLGDVWARLLGEWLPASQHRLGSGGTYEIYVNDPSQAPKEQLVTELYVHLAS